jgi:glyoxylate reductase
MTRPRVYVTRQIPEAALLRMQQDCDVRVWDRDEPVPRETLLREMREAAGLFCLLTESVDEELLAGAPHLRVVSNLAVGFDNVDVPAATRRGIAVCNTPGVLTETTADLAFALLMASARRVVEADQCTRSGCWKNWGPMFFLGQDIHHATLGLVGLGRIGAEVARRAQGFSMRILYCDPKRHPDLEAQLGLEPADFETLLRQSDFVSLHTPLNDQTYHFMAVRQFNLM